MKLANISLCLILLLSVGVSTLADDSTATSPAPDAEKIVVVTSTNAKEVREYKVSSSIKGKLPVPDLKEPLDLDAAVSYKIRHKYSVRDDDGLLALEISMLEGEINTQGEKLSMSPNLYPKLTVLLDQNWRFDGYFGASKEQLTRSLPGFSYSNLIVLFYLYDGDKPHVIGDKWESNVKLPGYGTYKFVTTLKGIEEIDGMKAATVHQDITWIITDADEKQIAAASAAADSSFAIADGKLIKSHIECRVAPVKQEDSANSVNSKIDILLAK